MKIIDLLDHDEQAVCRAKGTERVNAFLLDLPHDIADEEKFDRLYGFFQTVRDKTKRCCENFDQHKFKRRGNDKEDLEFLKILAKGNLEGVQMMDDICEAMVEVTLSADMKRTFKICSTDLGIHMQKLQEGKNIVPFPQPKPSVPAGHPSFDMAVGK